MTCPGSCWHSSQSHHFLAPLVTGMLQTYPQWPWRVLTEELCSLRTYQSAREREGQVPRACTGEEAKKEFVSCLRRDRGPKFSFFTKRRDIRGKKRKKEKKERELKSELRIRMFLHQDQKWRDGLDFFSVAIFENELEQISENPS